MTDQILLLKNLPDSQIYNVNYDEKLQYYRQVNYVLSNLVSL